MYSVTSKGLTIALKRGYPEPTHLLVTAISAYSESELNYVHSLGRDVRAVCSPNITLGNSFLIVAANFLRKIAPFADIEIRGQHFKEIQVRRARSRKNYVLMMNISLR